jgi:hypothetical protein
MPMLGKRRVLGMMVGIARVMGLLLIILAILSLPQMGFLTARLREGVGMLSSLVLGLTGVLLLVAVECFLRFFDQFMSRN